MRRSVLVYMFAFITGVMLYSCTSSDEKIKRSVESALVTNNVSGVTTETRNGVVTLTGTVDTPEQRMSAENAARSVSDVKSVNNQIQVTMPTPTPTPTTTTTTTTTSSTDQTMINSINSNLTSAGFSGINVAVSNGEVTLTGNVNRADLQRVMQIANDARPTRVNNQLTVR